MRLIFERYFTKGNSVNNLKSFGMRTVNSETNMATLHILLRPSWKKKKQLRFKIISYYHLKHRLENSTWQFAFSYTTKIAFQKQLFKKALDLFFFPLIYILCHLHNFFSFFCPFCLLVFWNCKGEKKSPFFSLHYTCGWSPYKRQINQKTHRNVLDASFMWHRCLLMERKTQESR